MKDKGIDNALLKDIDTEKPSFKGFQSIRKLFWKYLNLLGVPFSDPCCPTASTTTGGGSGYLVCLPIVTQVGIGVPTSVNLGDTIGLNSWTRFSAGFYYNLTDADFPADANKIQFVGQTDSFFIPLYSAANTLQGWLKMLATDVGGKIEIELNIKNAAGADADLSDIFSGGLQIPEIRVYP